MQYGRNVDKRILNPTLIPKFDTSIRKLKRMMMKRNLKLKPSMKSETTQSI